MNARRLPALRAVRATAVLLIAVAAAPALQATDEGPLLPVVSLRYENGFGYREMAPDPDAPAEEDTQMEDYSRRHKLTLRLKVGPIPVEFSPGIGDPLWMEQVAPTFGKTLPAGPLAAMLGLPAEAIDENWPVQEVSTGLPHIMVPLRSLEFLRRAKVDRDGYFRFIEKTWAQNILVFCLPVSFSFSNSAHVLTGSAHVMTLFVSSHALILGLLVIDLSMLSASLRHVITPVELSNRPISTK